VCLAHTAAQTAHSDEGFAVCCSRQRTHGEPSHGEPYLYLRPNCGHTAKFYGESILTHGKKKVTDDGIRLNGRVCRVSACMHTTKSQCLLCARVGHTANPLSKFGT